MLITVGGIDFLEEEQINLDTILTCHSQKMYEERIGVPLRATVGYQCFYDKKTMKFQGLTFYAPSADTIGGQPREMFRYVLACANGTLGLVNGEVCLLSGNNTIIYSHLKPIRTSGSVIKGQIIGYVDSIPGGYGYGVSLRAYKDSDVWNIKDDIFNIPCLE